MKGEGWRARQIETASERKNRELFEMAGAGRRAPAQGENGTFKFHGGRCRDCINWPLCLPELGQGQAVMNYCARLSRGFKRAALERITQ